MRDGREKQLRGTGRGQSMRENTRSSPLHPEPSFPQRADHFDSCHRPDLWCPRAELRGVLHRTKKETNIYGQYTVSFIIYPSQLCVVYIIYN